MCERGLAFWWISTVPSFSFEDFISIPIKPIIIRLTRKSYKDAETEKCGLENGNVSITEHDAGGVRTRYTIPCDVKLADNAMHHPSSSVSGNPPNCLHR